MAFNHGKAETIRARPFLPDRRGAHHHGVRALGRYKHLRSSALRVADIGNPGHGRDLGLPAGIVFVIRRLRQQEALSGRRLESVRYRDHFRQPHTAARRGLGRTRPFAAAFSRTEARVFNAGAGKRAIQVDHAHRPHRHADVHHLLFLTEPWARCFRRHRRVPVGRCLHLHAYIIPRGDV